LKVSVNELRELSLLILRHLEESAGAIVELDKDMFWSVPSPELYNVYDTPQLTIGQLSESWASLKAMQGGESPSLSYGLVWLADLLRAIGQELVA
jgi:hypothetical protein